LGELLVDLQHPVFGLTYGICLQSKGENIEGMKGEVVLDEEKGGGRGGGKEE
jgi:hypothetical protein